MTCRSPMTKKHSHIMTQVVVHPMIWGWSEGFACCFQWCLNVPDTCHSDLSARSLEGQRPKLLVSAVLASKFHVSHWHSRIFDRHLEELLQLASGIITCWFCFNTVLMLRRCTFKIEKCLAQGILAPIILHGEPLRFVMNNLHLQGTPAQRHTVSHTTDWWKRTILSRNWRV